MLWIRCKRYNAFYSSPNYWYFHPRPSIVSHYSWYRFWSFLLFPLSNAHSVISSLFQALGKARQAIFLSSLRIYLLLIPALLILPKIYGIEGIWYSFPLADAIAFAVVVYFVFRERSNLIGLDLASKAHAQADQTNQTQKVA